AVVAIAYQSRHKIHLADFTWNKFVASVGQANIFLLFLCLVGIYGCYALRAVRWQRFCKYVGPTNFLNTYAGTLMGFAAIFVLGRAGEPVRPLLLARKERLPVSSLFGIFFLERFCDFAAAAALACLSLLVFPNRLSDAGADMGWVESARHGGWLLLAAMTALIVMLVVYRLHGAAILDRILARWRDAGGFRSRFASGITGISEGLQAIRTTSDLLAAIFYTAAHWVLATLIYLGVAKAFGASFMHSDMNFSGAMLLLAVTLVGSVLQLPGVGGGAQIASFIGLTKIFGVEQEPAAAMAVVLWLITFAGGTLAGIPLLIHEGMSVGELRQLARAEAEAEESGKHIAVTEDNGVSPSSRAAKAKPLEEKP
ncbi:MAG TPA: lysylphosphatidylglycerol synthase transmembrane domain-containing protein, partial [Candidatus Acidoferrales bacterium]|nr:lysylphosphatidylglycerol synthase transmembrane domain-containing protein [Candidatus Acidoferrales bacterium]